MPRLVAVGVAIVGPALAFVSAGDLEAVAQTIPADLVFTGGLARDRQALYLLSARGSRPRLLLRDAADAAASPDGQEIAFVRRGRIWIVRRDTSNQRQLTKPTTKPTAKGVVTPAHDSHPSWSPDGQTIYFERTQDNGETSSIYSMGTDGSHPGRLTHGAPACQIYPSPSPDGSLIAFAEAGDCRHWFDATLVAVSLSGHLRRLPFAVPHGDSVDSPTWSPDGRHLAYGFLDEGSSSSGEPGRSGLYVSIAGHSPPHAIALAFRYVYEPAWSPDGRWIAFDRSPGISLVRSDGTGLRRLVRRGSDPTWLPAS